MNYKVGDKVILKTEQQLLDEGLIVVDNEHEPWKFANMTELTSVKYIREGQMRNMLGQEVVIKDSLDSDGDVLLIEEEGQNSFYFPSFCIENYSTDSIKRYKHLKGLYE